MGMFRSKLVATAVTAVFLSVAIVSADSTKAAPVPTTQWNMTAVGDIMFDRYVRTLINTYGPDYPFTAIRSQLTGDVVMANLEGPITTSTSVATNTRLIFTFDPKTAPALKRAGFTTLSLANNHTLNFGQTGLTATRTTLRANGLNFFGDPSNRTDYHLTKTINGRRVTFLGYHGLAKGIETVLTDVRRAHAKGELVIVMAHSGTEYNLKFTARQQTDYRRLIDAGADVIIAAHPHVVEPIEIYKNKLIAYSLGNFVFDQYFSSDTQQGLMLKLTFGSQLTIKFIPLDLTRVQPKVAGDALRQKILNRVATTSIGTRAQKSMLASGSLTLPSP